MKNITKLFFVIIISSVICTSCATYEDMIDELNSSFSPISVPVSMDDPNYDYTSLIPSEYFIVPNGKYLQIYGPKDALWCKWEIMCPSSATTGIRVCQDNRDLFYRFTKEDYSSEDILIKLTIQTPAGELKWDSARIIIN